MIVANTLRGQKTDAKAHLSASQLRQFSQCSLGWLLSRHHTPERVGSALRFGGAIHKSLQAFYQGRLEGRAVTQAEMLEAYVGSWADETKRYPGVPVQFGKGETEDGLRELASRMFESFLANVKPGQVVAVEEPFEVPLADGLPPLVGHIDLIEVRDDGNGNRLAVVDHKTTARRPSGDSGPSEDQLVLYGLGSARSGILRQFNMPLELRYDVLTKTKSPELVPVQVKPTRRDAVTLIAKAKAIWRAMSQEIVWPNQDWWCQGCGYTRLCAAWAKG